MGGSGNNGSWEVDFLSIFWKGLGKFHAAKFNIGCFEGFAALSKVGPCLLWTPKMQLECVELGGRVAKNRWQRGE